MVKWSSVSTWKEDTNLTIGAINKLVSGIIGFHMETKRLKICLKNLQIRGIRDVLVKKTFLVEVLWILFWSEAIMQVAKELKIS